MRKNTNVASQPRAGKTNAKTDAALAKDFMWSKDLEPHCVRKTEILKAHPEIQSLMGHCPRTKYMVVASLAAQIFMCALVRDWSFWPLLLATYAISGTMNHSMALGIHEISHNLAFKNPTLNKLLGIFGNIQMGIPSAIVFKRYHMEHHRYQGEHIVDVDIPTRAEALLFTSVPGKLIWCFLQPLFYSLRPIITNPKRPGPWELLNALVVFGFDAIIYALFGWRSVFYLVIGTLLGLGLHPIAGHFLAEHVVFEDGIETYDYIGPLNFITYNVGYHNEHHDFPNVPGSRLPQLRAMAPEFYENLPTYTSWTMVLVNFIFRADMSLWCRMKRQAFSDEDRQKLSDREHHASVTAVTASLMQSLFPSSSSKAKAPVASE